MASEVHWTAAAIAKARKQSSASPDSIWLQVEALLKGKLSERELPSGELRAVAKVLIASMAPTPPKGEPPR
jgi:hypothetical protein